MSLSCFVLMPFSKEMKEVYDYAIKPAAESCGYKCERADEFINSNNIISDIIRKIFKADVIIADITHKNPNVLYELGIAHSIDTNVIIIADKSSGSLPFDLSIYRTVFYEKSIDGIKVKLHEYLKDRICKLDEWRFVANNPVQEFKPVKYSVPLESQEVLEQTIANLKLEVNRLENVIQEQSVINYSILVSEIEFRHLHKLYEQGEFNYVKRGVFLIELQHLEAIGLIKAKPGMQLDKIPDEGDLKRYVQLTADAENYLRVKLLGFA